MIDLVRLHCNSSILDHLCCFNLFKIESQSNSVSFRRQVFCSSCTDKIANFRSPLVFSLMEFSFPFPICEFFSYLNLSLLSLSILSILSLLLQLFASITYLSTILEHQDLLALPAVLDSWQDLWFSICILGSFESRMRCSS